MANFKCRLCRSNFQSQADWTRHLIQSGHQSRSRTALAYYWSQSLADTPETEKGKILVARATFHFDTDPQQRGNELAELFLGNLQQNWKSKLQDMVWATGNPKMAYLRFGDKETVDEIVETLGTLHLGQDRIVLKNGTDYSNWEWNGMMEIFLAPVVSVNEILQLR